MKKEPLVIEGTYPVPVEKLWKAISDPGQMKQWYFDIKGFRPEIGCEFTFEGKKDDLVYVHLCKVTELVVNKKLSYSWRYQGFEGHSRVQFELFPEGNSTRLRLTHEGLESFPANNPDFARESFEAGWNYITGTSLKEFLEKDGRSA